MFYMHPDHLGSAVYLTDDAGRVVSGSGPDASTAQVVYRPYGEIDRTKSGGPDIFHFKYTGQEEDPESGLYYYKARHYDPVIGRFIQADSLAMPSDAGGMNRYMYVEGNPVKYADPEGNVYEWMYFANIGMLLGTLIVTAAVASVLRGGCSGLFSGPACGYNWMGSGNNDNYWDGPERNKIVNDHLRDKYGIIGGRDELNWLQILLHPELIFFVPPKPNSYMDRVSMRHDREVQDSQFQCLGGNAECRSQMRTANDNFIKGYLRGIVSGDIFKQRFGYVVTDFIGGSIGFLAFGIENIVYDLVNYNDHQRNATEQKIGELLEGFEGTIIPKIILAGMQKGSALTGSEITAIIDREINRMREDFVVFEVSKLCTSNAFCEKYPWLAWYAFVNNPINL